MQMYEDPDSSQYIDGTAVHWYGDPWNGPERLQMAHDVDPSKFLMYTEACEGDFIYMNRQPVWRKFSYEMET